MVFEKPMDRPCTNWNISENIFVFSEKVDCEIVWLVKLSLEKEPVVFKFNMPAAVIEGQANSKWDKGRKNYIIDEDHPLETPNQAGTINDENLNKLDSIFNEESVRDLNDTIRDQNTAEQDNLYNDFHMLKIKDYDRMRDLGEARHDVKDDEDDYEETEDKQLNGESVSTLFKY